MIYERQSEFSGARPRAWRASLCVACKTCEVTCALNRSSLSRRLPEALYEEVPPQSRVRVEPTGGENGFPLQCRHCQDAPCLDACPAGAGHDVLWTAGMPRDELLTFAACDRQTASYVEMAGGDVCGICVAACPFGRRVRA